MSGSRARRTLVPVALAAWLSVAGGVAAWPALGHTVGESFQLPVPLNLYLIGAATAVGASFVVTAVVARSTHDRPRYPTIVVPGGASWLVSVALQVLGMAWWYGAIAVAVFIGGISPLPETLFWIGIWVALPITAVLVGNPWPSLSPFRTTHALLERLLGLRGDRRLDLGLRYPPQLTRWPAVLLLLAALYAELVLPGASQAATVGVLMIGYTLVTLAGMLAFGRLAWLRNAEFFELELGWLGRIGPIGRRVVNDSVCAGCEEACDPSRCVDCPECAVVAEAGERRVELRPWIAGLAEVRRAGWSDVAFIILLLSGVTYDGIQETGLWASVASALLTPLFGIFGPNLAFTVLGLAGLVGIFALFLLAFALAMGMTRLLRGPGSSVALAPNAGVYASTLLPIAAGYLIAHYGTLVIAGILRLPALIANPLLNVFPDLTWIPSAAVWYLSVGAIVTGHIAAIVLAHRIALRDVPHRPTLAGLPLVALMIGYTVLSLWIIAQPIVIDPGITPVAYAPHR